MRIGIFDPYLDDLGGGEKYMMNVATCLAKNHDITVFWDDNEDIEAIKKRFDFSFDRIKVSKNIFSPKVSLFQRIKDFKNYDAFIVLSDGSIPFVFPKKLFLHIQQPLPKRKKLNLKDYIKRAYISAIFYNSQFTKNFNDLLFSGVKSMVIYPPISIETEMNKQIKKENIIIHVGRFRLKNSDTGDYKKQGFMLATFKKLVDRGFKNWKFVLVVSVKKEEKNEFKELQDSVKGYPVEFHINKPNKELFTLYNKAKIYWHASGYGEDIEKHPELAEHFGMSTVEAMGSGVVPVVINSGGQKEIVTDGKDGMLWNNAEELMEMTNRLTKDEKLWLKLSKNAIQRAKDFSEERFDREVQRLVTE